MVQGAKRSSVLVVVPVISWLGVDRVDDQRLDGIPNTLTDGTNVHWPRVMTGLPAQFADDSARLLVFLDRHKIRYDLTSDLDLDQSRNPRASDRDGVLLAGSERWITRPLARRMLEAVVARRLLAGVYAPGGFPPPGYGPARTPGDRRHSAAADDVIEGEIL